MDINIVNEMIDELIQCDTTYQNIRDLAALYKVKEQFLKEEPPIPTPVEKELSDILPAYESYIECKKKYQLKETTKESLSEKIKLLCIEVFEFISIIYSNTETKEERAEILRCVDRLTKELGKVF